jgi:hypothetical protein
MESNDAAERMFPSSFHCDWVRLLHRIADPMLRVPGLSGLRILISE